ncbi:related to translation initiation factor IF-2, mitochondrial [Phialocephala subalpina]|uniref:Translation initiation factor IF-2, mitochondrial n=1 Tax=Phialocephala subalpina TaxID=576137 RepID=A0A1L7XHC0_9HELO|nr:related to translation initiation factor IF-2, mitochondrial [Phialocephala subalpina]
MRGRSLLKESSGPSLCAFCAHRLGQARRPSHVQRRFLQSSRPVAKPPAEAAAIQGDDGPPTRPSWGAAVPARPAGLGPSASWGKPTGPGGIPPGLASNWGGAIPGGVGIPVGRARQQAESAGSGASAMDDLLPHERRAREINMERELARKAKEEAQKVQAEKDLAARRVSLRIRGVGPESTRAGRPLPRMKTEEERIAEAQREKARQKAFETWNRKKEVQEHMEKQTAGRQGSIVRHVMGGFDWKHDKSAEKDDNSWGQLRTRPQKPPSETPEKAKAAEQSKSPASLCAEGRAQREEQARSGRYTPIGVRRVDADSVGRWDSLGERLPPGSRSLDLSRSIPQPERSPVQSRPGPTSPVSRTAADLKDDGLVKFTSMFGTSTKAPPQQRDVRPEEKKVGAEEEEEEQRRGREKPRRKARTRYEDEKPTYEDIPRGRGKDKAKRRQQFARTDEDELAEEEAYERAEAKRLRKEEKAAKKAARAVAPTPILLPEYISVSNLATALRVRLEDFVYKMEELGFEETSHDYVLNAETSGLIAQEYNFEPVIDRGDSEDLKAREPAPDQSILPSRPPVVTIMGHVDHGKTTLLDYLRKSSVAAGEHGGITQHIGAFSVPMPSGKIITFLDTPGHAAFLSMRQRGANVTDIVILVVAADDSVKPQTIEAINHAKAAKVPVIVAINKIDKEDSNIDRVKQDLARHGVDVEDFGGDTQVVCVSGKTGQGMDELEEAAVTLSEILDHRAERDGPAEGWIIEASIKSMGKVATVLVRRGTMRPGDFIVAGKTWARIRCLRNEAGVEIDEAGPGTPVEIDGWREQPEAGDEVLQAPDEGKAKSVVDYRLEKQERERLAEDMEAINENRKTEQDKRDREKAEAAALAEADGMDVPETDKKDKPSGPKEIYFIIKGDVSGSVEAVIDSIAGLGNNEVRPHILRSGVGQLSEFDIEHAAVAKGHLINFNTAVDANISRLAEENKVSILDHNIIYRLVDDVKAELSKHLPPLITQKVMGEAEVAQIFSITVKGRQQKAIAGCKVRNGTISKTAKARVLRGGQKIFDGALVSLKNVKKDVPEMKKGGECGIGFEDWSDFQVGDQVQSYEEIHEKRTL